MAQYIKPGTALGIHSSVTREKLVEDVKILTKDVQHLLKATASVAGEKAAEARVKVEESLKEVAVAAAEKQSRPTTLHVSTIKSPSSLEISHVEVSPREKILSLLSRIPSSDSFESAELAEKISLLVAQINPAHSDV